MDTNSSQPAVGTGPLGLVEVIQRLSMARDIAGIQEIVRRAARQLTGADGRSPSSWARRRSLTRPA
jgi:hypothetical protein